MKDLIFDRATEDDIPELIRLRTAYITDDCGSVSADERRVVEEQLPDYFGRKLGRELIAFVARSREQLVASVFLLITEKPANPSMLNGLTGEVLNVYTAEEYRGQGICTRLMKNMIEYAKENRLCRIDLKATKEGFHLYKELGFEEGSGRYTDMRMEL